MFILTALIFNLFITPCQTEDCFLPLVVIVNTEHIGHLYFNIIAFVISSVLIWGNCMVY